jgi:hypothetical protein
MQAATQIWNLAGHLYTNTLPPAAIPSAAPLSARLIFASGKQVLVDDLADFFAGDLPKIRPGIPNARYDWSRQLDCFCGRYGHCKAGCAFGN